MFWNTGNKICSEYKTSNKVYSETQVTKNILNITEVAKMLGFIWSGAISCLPSPARGHFQILSLFWKWFLQYEQQVSIFLGSHKKLHFSYLRSFLICKKWFSWSGRRNGRPLLHLHRISVVYVFNFEIQRRARRTRNQCKPPGLTAITQKDTKKCTGKWTKCTRKWTKCTRRHPPDFSI